MKCVKVGYVLDNGLIVKSDDIITIICNDGEVGTGKIIDIGTNGIMISLEDGYEMDCTFDEIKDVLLIKQE